MIINNIMSKTVKTNTIKVKNDSVKKSVDIEDLGKLVTSEIISASRRTDIPAFYMGQVVDAMKEGRITATNRYGHSDIISLDPKDVKCIVWWSKNYKNWLIKYKENKKLFDQYKAVFNYTITGGDELEPGLTSSLDERLDQLKELCELFGPETIKYRFDPIVTYLDMKTGEKKDNLANFKKIIKFVGGCGVKEVIFAFCLPYKNVCARMKKYGKLLVNPSDEEKHAILDMMIKVTDKYGMRLSSCCNNELNGYEDKVFPSKCVDGKAIEGILGEKLKKNFKDKGQRDECNCAFSKDIGSYTMQCANQCFYCYSNPTINPKFLF